MLNFFTLAQQNQGGDVLAGIVGIVLILIWIALIVLVIAGSWKVFTKAGQPGWAVLIPIFNTYILLKIVGRPWWWLLLLFIPFVNFIIAIIVALDAAKSFGRGIGFGLGLAFLTPIFVCILGFGSDKYVGPAAAMGGSPA
jgi:hypothetical protein